MAHVECSTDTSVLLGGVFLTVALLGMLKFCWFPAGGVVAYWGGAILIIVLCSWISELAWLLCSSDLKQ